MLVETIVAHPIVEAILSHPIVQACANSIVANTVTGNAVIANTITANTVPVNTVVMGQDIMLIGEVTSIKIFAGYIGPILLIGLMGNYMMNDAVVPIYYAYGGLMMEIVMSMLASAYAIVKIVNAAVKNNGAGVVGSYYYTYHSKNQLGNYMSMWELLNVIVFLTWAMVIMILGVYVGGDLWVKFETLEEAGELTKLEGFKYLLLGFVTAAGIWVAGLNVGDMSSSMLGLFDEYNTKTEAINTDGEKDTAGTALIIDASIHLIETYVTMSVVTSIVIFAVGTMY